MDIFVGNFVKSIVYNLPIKDLKDLDLLINMNDEDIKKISDGRKEFNNNKILEFLRDF